MRVHFEEHRKAAAALGAGLATALSGHFVTVLAEAFPAWALSLAAVLVAAVASWAVENRVDGWNVQHAARFLAELLEEAEEAARPDPAYDAELAAAMAAARPEDFPEDGPEGLPEPGGGAEVVTLRPEGGG